MIPWRSRGRQTTDRQTDDRQTDDRETDRQTGGRWREEEVTVSNKQQVLVKTVSTYKVNLPVKKLKH